MACHETNPLIVNKFMETVLITEQSNSLQGLGQVNVRLMSQHTPKIRRWVFKKEPIGVFASASSVGFI